jgi:DNA-binding CsgD family transcriptional regulator
MALFAEALLIPKIDRFPFDLARVHLLYGERLRRARATNDSRVQLSAALEIFQRLGASPWVTRASNELRAAGQGPLRQTGNATLTPQEREIALLAAEGLTNKEIGERLFLSHRTVSAHLYRVFPKLGITSRAALRDALEEPPPKPSGSC